MTGNGTHRNGVGRNGIRSTGPGSSASIGPGNNARGGGWLAFVAASLTPAATTIAIAIVAILCAFVTYAAARARFYEHHAAGLDQSARDVLQRAETVAREASAVLGRALQLHEELCSDRDLDSLRDLVFRAREVRDIGRLHDGQLVCTTTDGRLPRPYQFSRAPTLTTSSGEALYVDYDLLTPALTHALVIQRADVNAVVDPHAFDELLPPPQQYSIWLRTDIRDGIVGVAGEGVSARPTRLKMSGRLHVGARLTAIACSRVTDFCAAAIATDERIHVRNAAASYGFAALGGLAGAALTAVALLALRRRQPLVTQLRDAIRNDEMRVVYEPVIELPSGRMLGVEALVRWQDRNGEPILPDVFIALAEDMGLIRGITEFVIRRVSAELGELLRASEFQVSINVAAEDLIGPALMQALRRHVVEQRIPAARVALELTERSTADREQLAQAVARLRQEGHPVYVDDFGAGYSSLSYLQELAIDSVKIDRSFIRALGTQAVTASVLPQILSIAATLNLRAVVEGVETQAQEDALRALGVRYVQGWLYGQPMTAAELIERIRKNS